MDTCFFFLVVKSIQNSYYLNVIFLLSFEYVLFNNQHLIMKYLHSTLLSDCHSVNIVSFYRSFCAVCDKKHAFRDVFPKLLLVFFPRL